jgi:hypothetical protein
MEAIMVSPDKQATVEGKRKTDGRWTSKWKDVANDKRMEDVVTVKRAHSNERQSWNLMKECVCWR